MMRSALILICVAAGFSLYGQYEDDFEDETLGSTPDMFNPALGGDISSFLLVDEGGDKQLRSNAGSGAQDYYLSIPSNQIDNSTWEFFIDLKFNPSGVNYVDVYLVADQSNLTSVQNGYFVRIGDSEDWIAFHKIVGGSVSSALISTPEDILNNSSSKPFKIQVSRDGLGNWELFTDEGSTGTFTSVGTVTDTDVTSSSVFGFLVVQSSAASVVNNHFFDDFYVGPTPTDMEPPTIQSVTAISETQVDVKFSENVDETSSQDSGNYAIDGEVAVNSAVRDGSDNSLVHLTTSTLDNGSTYTITINNVEDENTNPIDTDSEATFDYIVTETAEPGDIVINEFMADPTPATSFPNIDFIELVNVSDKYLQLSGWTIKDNSVSGISDAFGNYIFEPGEYLIITDIDFAVDFSIFGEVLGVDNFPNLNSTGEDQIIIRDASESTLAELTYSSSFLEDAITLELINPNDPCLSIASYALSTDPLGGTPGTQNSVFDDTPDTSAPTIQSYSFSNSLTINFSERMDAASLSSGSYSVSDGLTIDQVNMVGEFPLSIEVTFVEAVEQGVLYEFTISNVSDCSGNLLEETTIKFGLGRSPSFNELIITEVMFDPDPQRELPEAEYIEILNATSEILSSDGISLTDATKTIDLPSRTLSPGEYYVLTTTSASSEFTNNAIGVSGFPSLNNSGEHLTLSMGSELIFSLEYDPDWHEEDKSDGGVSLEMRDVTNPCLENGNNWTSSQDVRGGTPGMPNSISEVIPDNFGPEIVSAVAFAQDSIRVEFDEKIDPKSANMAIISLSPSLPIDQVSFDLFSPKSLTIALEESLAESAPYTLNVENVTDCSGNEIQQGETVFALPVLAEENEIKLSEVLFNPRPNGVDFVELYNDSDKYISLKGWQLARLVEGEVDAPKILAEEELVISPEEFLVFTSSSSITLSNYPKAVNLVEISSLPSYNDDEGTVLLLSPDDEIMDQFDYSDDYHYDLLKSVEGVSLERVSYEESSNNPNNWRSAASTEGFATPGYVNSQSFTSEAAKGRVTADPEVFIPGNSGSGRDFTTINYQFEQAGKFANVNIYDQLGRHVKNLARGASLSTSGFLRWDGDTDDGKMARMGYYLIIFEIYDSSGNSEIIKETVVVGRDF
ncbi:lamin tail domain-containing protein [Ekhidna sp.]